MSFLDKHFYTDAGIVLPEGTELKPSLFQSTKYEEDLEHLTLSDLKVKTVPNKDTISTVLEEDARIVNISDEDLRELEKSTNITDDMKVNLQKINKSKSLTSSDSGVKRRNKRYSCILPTGQSPLKTSMNRRSLNIPNEGSKIPISFRLRKMNDEKENSKINSETTVSKTKSGDTANKKLNHYEKHTKGIDNNVEQFLIPKPSQINPIKENSPLNSNVKSVVPNSSNIKNNSTKVSSLPVLTR